MVNNKQPNEPFKLLSLDAVPKEFIPDITAIDTSVTYGNIFSKSVDDSVDDEKSLDLSDLDDYEKKETDKRLIWPLICWICRNPITKLYTYILCSGVCKRSYHIKCHDFMKTHFNHILYQMVEDNGMSELSSNKTQATTSKDMAQGKENIINPVDIDFSPKDSSELYKQYIGDLQNGDRDKSILQNEHTPSQTCFFCKISHVGCNGCRQFFPMKDAVKCAITECSTFYCFPSCISKTRKITPDKRVIELHMKVYGNLDNLTDSNGKPLYICHSHTCWSCYDCDRYSYYWENLWRSELTKDERLTEAWNDLKTTCRGKVESSYFLKGRKITKPQRYPDIKSYRSFFQTKHNTLVDYNPQNPENIYASSDDQEHFQKGPSNTLLKCVRCDRTWCIQCSHPDVQIIPNSGKQIICHDCIHIQVVCTLAHSSKETNSRVDILNKECSMPTLRITSSHPHEIFTQVKNFITEQAVYEEKLSLEPVFITKPPFDGVDDDYLLNMQKKTPLKSKSKNNRKKHNSKSALGKYQKESTNIGKQDRSLKKGFQNIKSKEWNNIIKGCDEAIVAKVHDEFKYITTNLITAETRKLISIPDSNTRCTCEISCGPDCSNILKNVECTPKNCSFHEKNCGNRRFTNISAPKLKLGFVEGKGIGAFATEDIEIDELVCEYVGEVITHSDFQRSLSSWSFAEIDDNNQCHWYIMKIHKDIYIDSTHLGNVARFINHSCDPNCSSIPINVRGIYRMGVFAQRKIIKGEEVTYNYGFTSKGVGGGFQCRCNAKNCRGIIGIQITHSPESLMNIESTKHSGAEIDVLSQLTSDMASLSMANKLHCLRQQPSPIDVLNGIWTCGDLYRYDKLISRQNTAKGTKDLVYKSPNGTNVSFNPLSSFLADNIHVSEAQFNYVKFLMLNGLSLMDYELANTKQFATNIPWAIVALGNDTSYKAMECSTTFVEFCSLAKRFIQNTAIVMAKQKSGDEASENIQNLMDLTWGATEACFACGGYGDCKSCDFCGDVLHDDNNCGEFYVNRIGNNLCSCCQNSDHRYKWLLSKYMERERCAMELWALRTQKYIDRHYSVFDKVISSDGNIDIKPSTTNSRNNNQSGQIYINPDRLFCSIEDYKLFNDSPNQFSERRRSEKLYCIDSVSNFECFCLVYHDNDVE
ncbi:hypothetical protein BEWA_010720 [Theileria equi strain WA]|uniref:Uncharacterized protein n=1 Tax=Theileria equi strain WA TaxID=1537102 RepID=L0B1E8_THEEQ|nr:hypothetical protein BEWA_010720 [Theileria equi strain WA]AFZ81655.1 hypothetical protein BEWA_010720 [Theileria equi strain WA]|eukprot:XP_004831321.1 hypothetical protein BEWA_010720 [Theileria equi strain WA]